MKKNPNPNEPEKIVLTHGAMIWFGAYFAAGVFLLEATFGLAVGAARALVALIF